MQLHVLLQAQGSVREQSPPLANLTPAERGRNLILPLTWKSPHSLPLKACSKTLEVPNHAFLFPNLKVYSHHLPSFFKPLFQGENFCRYSPASCVKTLVWDSSPQLQISLSSDSDSQIFLLSRISPLRRPHWIKGRKCREAELLCQGFPLTSRWISEQQCD